MICESNFKKLAAQGYNRIPLIRQVLADFDTPLSTYKKISSAPYSLSLIHISEPTRPY